MKRGLIILAGITLLLAAGGCTKKQETVQAAAPAVIPVRTAPVELRRVDRSISVTGSLLPDETVSLGSEVAGRVQAIYFDFGHAVRRGQAVAQLDATDYRLQLEQAQSLLAQAHARLGVGANADAPVETPAMKQAQAQMEDARFKYDSAAQLVKSGDISAQQFTEIEKAFRARQAAYEATHDDMRVQRADIEGLQAQVELARKRINDCTIRAPFEGVVSDRPVSPGQYMKENTTIVTLVKTNPLRLRVDLPESAAASVKTGSTLTFVTDAAPGAEFHAVVRQLSPSLDPKSRMLAVEARMPVPDPCLRPGMFVQVRLVTQPGIQITVVPEAALYRLAGINKIFVIRDGTAHQLRLDAPEVTNGWVEVPAGIVHPGDAVAVTNLFMLVDGSPVGAGRS